MNTQEMLRVLDSIARDRKVDREAAQKTVREYAVLAAERCEELRKQLARADEFARLLLQETLVQPD